MSDPDQSSPPPVSEWPTANQGLTRRDVLNLLFKHLWVVLGTFLLVASIVWTGIAMLPATYVAKAKLLIRVEQQGTPSFMSGIAAYRDARDADPASRKLETEMGLLTARPLAEDVVSKLDIDYRSVYHPPYVHYLEPVSAFVAQIEGWWYGRPPAPSARGFTETVVAFGRALEVKGEVAKCGCDAEHPRGVAEGTGPARGRRRARPAGAHLHRPGLDARSHLRRRSPDHRPAQSRGRAAARRRDRCAAASRADGDGPQRVRRVRGRTRIGRGCEACRPRRHETFRGIDGQRGRQHRQRAQDPARADAARAVDGPRRLHGPVRTRDAAPLDGGRARAPCPRGEPAQRRQPGPPARPAPAADGRRRTRTSNSRRRRSRSSSSSRWSRRSC